VAVLGGETAIQGAGRNPETDGVLIRNIDNDAFDTGSLLRSSARSTRSAERPSPPSWPEW
jgi:hypothetical protein